MIVPEKLNNSFMPGDLVGCWGEIGLEKIVYVYIAEDLEDPWTAILLGPDGFTKVRYVHLEAL